MQNNDISIPEDKKNWQTITLSNGKSLYYKVNNARIIEIHSDCFIEEEYIKDEELDKCIINSISFNEDYKIGVGNEFNIKILDRELKYKIKYIEKLDKNKYLLITDLRNKSSKYLTPILGGIKEQYFYDWYLINSFIQLNDNKSNNFLYLQYRFFPAQDYLKFETEITTHPLFVNKIDKNEFVIFKFAIPDESKNDIQRFKLGQYSKFSDILKKKIIDFHNLYTSKNKLDYQKNNLFGILYKSDYYKDKLEKELECTIEKSIDLDSKPDLDHEILII